MASHKETASRILINLDQIRDARRISKEEEIIQRDAIFSLRTILKSRLAVLPQPRSNYDSTDMTERPHDVIAILGSRGSGKTTFLLSVLQDADDLRDGGGQKVLLPGVEGLVSLGLIDPTLIATKENLFLIIISRIQDVVLQVKGLTRNGPDYRNWEEKMRRLAGGLSAIDEVGADPLRKGDWDDNQFAMEEGLSMVRSHRRLEPYFHGFIEATLALINKKAFVLGLDDIDTSFEKGWPVLETIRRYLTSRHLIVLMSGDSELFSALVRKKQWENLGKELIERDRGKDYYRQLVDRLEDQYLQKILKPENRIFLDSVYTYYRQGNSPLNEEAPLSGDAEQPKTMAARAGSPASSTSTEISVRLPGETDEVALRTVMRALLVHGLFVTRGEDIRLYERALLELPVRTVAQVLYRFSECFRALTASQQEIGKPRPLTDEERKAAEAFHDDLINIFSGSLLQLGWSPNLLREMSPEDIGPLVAQVLVADGMLDPGYRLKPEFGYGNRNQAMIAVGAQIGGLMYRQPEASLDYMIKVGLPREIATSGGSTADVAHYIRFTGLDTMEPTLGVARRAAAYLRALNREKDRRTVQTGTIALYGDYGAKYPIYVMYGAEDSKQNLADQSNSISENQINYKHWKIWDYYRKTGSRGGGKGILYNTLNSVERNLAPNLKGLANLPMQLIVSGSAEQTPVASIFNLIGVIRDVMTGSNAEEIRQMLLRHAQLRSFPAPVMSDDLPEDILDVAEVQDDENVTEFPEQLKEIAEELWLWVTGIRRQQRMPLSAYMIAKIWARFYYTLLRIDTEVEKSQSPSQRYYCGELLHRCIVAFLNAAIVEEMLPFTAMTLKNPSLTDAPFISNLKRAEGKTDGSLFTLLFSCPLWRFYLDPQSSVAAQQKEASAEYQRIQDSSAEALSLYDLLNSLLIQRPMRLSSPKQAEAAERPRQPRKPRPSKPE